MTENDNSDKSQAGTTTEPSDTDASTAVHRQLATAGVRLNEAHSHLSALRTVTADSEGSSDIARAEVEALIECLEETRSQLDTALDQAEMAANNLGTADHQGDDGETPPDNDTVPDLLWNTASPCQPPLSTDPES